MDLQLTRIRYLLSCQRDPKQYAQILFKFAQQYGKVGEVSGSGDGHEGDTLGTGILHQLDTCSRMCMQSIVDNFPGLANVPCEENSAKA